MDQKATKPCQLCGHGIGTEQYKFVRPAFGSAWPAVNVTIRVCLPCSAGMTSGRFRGGTQHAEAIRKRLQRLTGRPWEWSTLRPRGYFTVGEGPIFSSARPVDELLDEDESAPCPPGVFCYGAPFHQER